MKNRREFVTGLAAAGIMGVTGASAIASEGRHAKPPESSFADRAYWLELLQRLALPVLENLAKGDLRKAMPVECHGNASLRGRFTHLEAFGRLICGISPWLELQEMQPDEAKLQSRLRELARQSLTFAVDPASPDFMNFNSGSQPLVDSAFLAQGIMRAPTVLWATLDDKTKKLLVNALKSTRSIPTPKNSNWVMFAAMVESALLEMGENTIEERLEDCLREMLDWYKGDGVYGDGEHFHFDGYNSFVIHPMLLDVLNVLKRHDSRFIDTHQLVKNRAQRFAAIQERLIGPDGSYPCVGRSVAYRSGVFHLLSQIALMELLPDVVQPAQVRCGMQAAMRKLMEPEGTFDQKGWLQIGLYGHQPALGESYISTGSLYLCAASLLPLGLADSKEFWRGGNAKWTSLRLLAGENIPADHALKDEPNPKIPKLKR